jgi:RNA polymerase sigma-70 factor (ECF subfamily)
MVKGGFGMTIRSLRTDDCIDEVIEKYSEMVYRLALAHAKNLHDAEDVFQDVFYRYISRPRSFENEEHRKAWLIRVTINRSRSLWSMWFKKSEELSEEMVFETREENDLYEYLKLLPEKYRSVIHLFYQEDMSIRQISEALGTRESTVRTWLTRARAILGEKLKGEFSDD